MTEVGGQRADFSVICHPSSVFGRSFAEVCADGGLHVFFNLLGQLVKRRQLKILEMPRHKFIVKRLLEYLDANDRRLRAAFSVIAVFMLSQLDPPVLAYKNKALARIYGRRKIII